jgi:hypothetical protein
VIWLSVVVMVAALVGGGAQDVDVGQPVPQLDTCNFQIRNRFRICSSRVQGVDSTGAFVGCDRRLFARLLAGHQNVGGKSPVSWTTDCGKRAALNARYP